MISLKSIILERRLRNFPERNFTCLTMRRKKLLFFSVLLILLLSGIIFNKTALRSLSAFLSASEKVDGNILIIEGWLPYNDLGFAIEEFRKTGSGYILTTGLKATPEYYNVNTDGYLIFQTGRILSRYNKPGHHTIAVKAASELDGINSAHFRFWINDSVAGDFLADKRKRKYTVGWNGPLSRIDSVMIQFDNDIRGDFGDRNLFVKELIFDNKLKIPFLNNSVYDISALDNKSRIVNNMNSNAEMTARRLIAMGVDPSVIIAVPGNMTRINRTLASALAVRDWLRKNNISVTGINIVSAGMHSRRTWMTFNRVLPYKVGIIALPDSKVKYSGEIRVLKTIREAIAFLWYSVILIPYSL
jgi:hypothetical protein